MFVCISVFVNLRILYHRFFNNSSLCLSNWRTLGISCMLQSTSITNFSGIHRKSGIRYLLSQVSSFITYTGLCLWKDFHNLLLFSFSQSSFSDSVIFFRKSRQTCFMTSSILFSFNWIASHYSIYDTYVYSTWSVIHSYRLRFTIYIDYPKNISFFLS